MEYYSVKFTFEIPVAVKEGSDEVDVYYAAKDEFPEFNVNEANVKIEKVTEPIFKTKRAEVNKLHHAAQEARTTCTKISD